MGNNPSKAGGDKQSYSTPSQSGGAEALSTTSHGSQSARNHVTSERRARRRPSEAFPANTIPATPFIETAGAQLPPSSHSSTRSATASLRSQSIGQAPTLTPASGLSTDSMGNQESKTAQAHKRHQSASAKPSSLPKPIDIQGPPPSQHVPTDPEPLSPDALQAPSLADESYQLPSAQYSRPPRLPLPIAEELHTPGSPIISPADISEPVDPLPRRSSVLSSGTADDDDLGDDLELLDGGLHPPVPTLIEWREGGTAVFFTGTFAGWDRKFRLRKE
jgi:hypothetical protein